MSEFLRRFLLKRRIKPQSLTFQSKSIAELRAGINYADMRKTIRLGHQEADLNWKKRYYALRTVWATLSIGLLGASLWFTFWLVEGVGTKRLDFLEYQTFLNIIAGEIIINVLGLVAIVMHFLFPKSQDQRNGAPK